MALQAGSFCPGFALMSRPLFEKAYDGIYSPVVDMKLLGQVAQKILFGEVDALAARVDG